MQRNRSKDWDAILDSAKSGDFSSIPADVLIHCYNSFLVSAQILLDRLESKKKYMCSGVILELANLEMHGNRQVWTLTLRIPVPNGGTDTVVRNVLLSTSFEEISMLPICSDGSTVTRSWWKSKEVVSHFKQSKYGLQAICPPANGTQP